jgi:hypothetical protein
MGVSRRSWRTLVDHLAAFGGTPLVTVFDRPKWRSAAGATEWTPTFAGFVRSACGRKPAAERSRRAAATAGAQRVWGM